MPRIGIGQTYRYDTTRLLIDCDAFSIGFDEMQYKSAGDFGETFPSRLWDFAAALSYH